MGRVMFVSLCLVLTGCRDNDTASAPGPPVPVAKSARTDSEPKDDSVSGHSMEIGVFPAGATLEEAADAAFPYGKQAAPGRWDLRVFAVHWGASAKRLRSLSFFIDQVGMPKTFVLYEGGWGTSDLSYDSVIVADCSEGSVAAKLDSDMGTPKIVHLEGHEVASAILDANAGIWTCRGDASVPATDGFVAYISVFREGRAHTTCQYHAVFPPSAIESLGDDPGDPKDPDSYAAYYATYMSRMGSFVAISETLGKILDDNGLNEPEQSEMQDAEEVGSQEGE